MSVRTNRIITILMAVFVLVTIAPTFTGQIIYVDNDGPADFNNIQAAIDDAIPGDTVIVADGRYFENINFNGRNITLTSTDPCNPDVVAATIIDGNNNGSVVTFNSGEDANCVLNGFTITNGNAERGGGMLNFESSPTITNCIFSNNSADFGGGMYNYRSSPTLTNCTFTENSAIWAPIEAGKGGGMYNDQSSPMLTNCTFIGNSADSGGGGIYNYISSPILNNCTFSANLAEFDGIIPAIYAYPSRLGGGMYNDQSSPTLTNCMFNGNSVKDSGGGMYNLYSSPTLTNCTLSSNSANLGGGMFNSESSTTLTNCTFNGNSASDSGGGMFNRESSPTLTNCTFNGNSASDSGGGMHNSNSNPTLRNCTFAENFADRYGGGMYNYRSSPTVDNCMFNGNSAGHYYSRGGGMYNAYSNPIVKKCTFSGNSADFGGGMFNINSSLTVDNCTFSGNSADFGGGMCNYNSSPKVKNCTFSGNLAPYGGGMYSYEGYDPRTFNSIFTATVINCIFWDNGSDGMNPTTVDATYSDIEGGWLGKGNIDTDPCFVEPGYWDSNDTQGPWDDVWIEGDYHLLYSSPCINAGDPNHLFDPNEKDLDGERRIIGGRIDMGAYEFISLPAEVRIIPRTINLNSKGKWITCYIWLPEGYDVADIDPDSVFLEDEIQPDQFLANQQQQVAVAFFSREEVQAILNIGEVELAISVHLTNGTIFEGTDVIKVVQEGGGKLIQASNPNPADDATNVDTNADLSWTASPYATSHNVYFGTGRQPPFISNQTVATFDPGTMDYETTYYWHIDEVSKWGITTGQLWRFTTLRDPGPGTGPGTGTTGTGTGPGTTGPWTGPTGPGTTGGTTGPGTGPGTTGPGTGPVTGP